MLPILFMLGVVSFIVICALECDPNTLSRQGRVKLTIISLICIVLGIFSIPPMVYIHANSFAVYEEEGTYDISVKNVEHETWIYINNRSFISVKTTDDFVDVVLIDENEPERIVEMKERTEYNSNLNPDVVEFLTLNIFDKYSTHYVVYMSEERFNK